MIGAQLQKALFDALTAADVAGGRVYANPPPSAAFPYVTIGDEQTIPDEFDCGAGFEIYPDVHIWSHPANGSKAEIKGLVADAAAAILAISAVSGFSVVSCRLDTSRVLRDPDGITEHAVLTFLFVLDEA